MVQAEEEGRRPVRELQEDLHDFRKLREYGPFVKYLALLDEIKLLRMRDLIQPPVNGLDGLPLSEFNKGVVSGVQLAGDSVTNFISELEKEIGERIQEEGPQENVDDGAEPDPSVDAELAP